MRVVVNGSPQQLPAGSTVGDLVAGTTGSSRPSAVAVARNGEVVPRSAWDTTAVVDGDRFELLAAAQGG